MVIFLVWGFGERVVGVCICVVGVCFFVGGDMFVFILFFKGVDIFDILFLNRVDSVLE